MKQQTDDPNGIHPAFIDVQTRCISHGLGCMDIENADVDVLTRTRYLQCTMQLDR